MTQKMNYSENYEICSIDFDVFIRFNKRNKTNKISIWRMV